MKIKLRAVEKKSPEKEKRRAEKAWLASCRNDDERKAWKKVRRFNKKVSGGTML
ncbi:MAG: hypothetical protein IJJ22_04760 [Oscillospiraceae bacterium]|nr:hypothetical protein [Oscillospiraceae bacterium]